MNQIPIAPNFKYTNQITINNKIINNQFDFIVLKREESDQDNPSESIILSSSNEFAKSFVIKGFNIYNKVSFRNTISQYNFNYNKDLNDDVTRSFLNYSSDFYYDSLYGINSRLKFILPIQLENNNKIINEDSNSITFGYQNQFSENRFFGYDLHDNTPRLIYGLESNNFFNDSTNIKLNQSFSFNKKNNYSSYINQTSKLSDYSFEINSDLNDISINFDTRLDSENLSKKEMNYLISYNKKIDVSLKYNETSKDSFKNNSNDTKSLKLTAGKSLNKNVRISLSSELDLKNDYDPYSNSLDLRLKDECSQFVISYKNSRFNDNFNTQPSETISFNFYMDYLGFFGYQQSTDLFFQETGSFNYGM